MSHPLASVALYINLLIWLLCTGHSLCEDKLFVAELYNSTIYVAESNEFSFVNATFKALNLSGLSEPVGIDYDHRNDMIYWTDQDLHTVNRAKLDGSFEEVIVQVSQNFGYPHGIVLDLIEDKVYWTDAYFDTIEIANLNGTQRMCLIDTGLDVPRGITLSNKRRKLFWTERGTEPKIEMSNMDGSNRTVLVSSDLVHPNGIALDFREQRLYWTDTDSNTIESIDLDDVSHRFTHLNLSMFIAHPFGITFYYEDIYFSEFHSHGVFEIDFPAGNVNFFGPSLPTPTEIHIYADRSCPSENYCPGLSTCSVVRRQPILDVDCLCLPGYEGSRCTDINECLRTGVDYPCDSTNGGCVNIDGSYQCTCNSGYQLGDDGLSCTDINECTDGTHNCHDNATCTNTPLGSFTCECMTGFVDDDPDNPGTMCADINECTDGTHNCHDNATCTNTPLGSFTCECKSGFVDDDPDNQGTMCSDIDECLAIPSPCNSSNEVCFNEDGGYSCRCDSGYERQNGNCTDVNECLTVNRCGTNEDCFNTDGNYTCNCTSGYEMKNDVCQDINECKSIPSPSCSQNEICRNEDGGYRCECDSGYERQNGNCTDINECRTGRPCESNEDCFNTDGNYTCSCSAGFERRNDACLAFNSVQGSLRFTHFNGVPITLTEGLRDPSSDEFHNMESRCLSVMQNQGLSGIQSELLDFEVTEFLAGSIVANFMIRIYNANQALSRQQTDNLYDMLQSNDPGLWSSSDGSVSLTVSSIEVNLIGDPCRSAPCQYGTCRTVGSDYICDCMPGYKGEMCDTLVTCSLPEDPVFSHIENPRGTYNGGDMITITCDDDSDSVSWTCGLSTGLWSQEPIDCERTQEFPVTIVIAVCVVVVLIVVAVIIAVVLYRVKTRRPRTDHRQANRTPSNPNNYSHDTTYHGAVGGGKEVDFGIVNPGFDPVYESLRMSRSQDTLPSIPVVVGATGQSPPVSPAGAVGGTSDRPPSYTVDDPNASDDEKNGHYEQAIFPFRGRVDTAASLGTDYVEVLQEKQEQGSDENESKI